MNYLPNNAQESQATLATILCCQCGTPILPNAANMCEACIRNEVDITDGIPKQLPIYFCKFCERYLDPPDHWSLCALESRELLTLCLKKLRGLSKVRLVDAAFQWTEPHSRRIKVILTIEKEIFASTIVQQKFVIEYVVHTQQCEDCVRVSAQHTWTSSVQIRQKVNHKKTIFYLEQLILKHNMHKDAVNVQQVCDGLDFFYTVKGHANRMVEFLRGLVPARHIRSEQLISQDQKSNTAKVKYSHAVEISPVCREDIICLPEKLATHLGFSGTHERIVLCMRLGQSLHIMDPRTLKQAEIPSHVYWQYGFRSLRSSRELVEFTVLDVEPVGGRNQQQQHYSSSNGKYLLADVELVRSSEQGMRDDTIIYVRTHLGRVLKSGDTVLAYDLATANFNDDAFSQLNSNDVPDVIIVRKKPSPRSEGASAKRTVRYWKLKRLRSEQSENNGNTMAMEEDSHMNSNSNNTNITETITRKTRKTKRSTSDRKDLLRTEEAEERDFEEFLQELERDPELRAQIPLYKDDEGLQRYRTLMEKQKGLQEEKGNFNPVTIKNYQQQNIEDEEEDNDSHEIALDELLDDLSLNGSDQEEEEDNGVAVNNNHSHYMHD